VRTECARRTRGSSA